MRTYKYLRFIELPLETYGRHYVYQELFAFQNLPDYNYISLTELIKVTHLQLALSAPRENQVDVIMEYAEETPHIACFIVTSGMLGDYCLEAVSDQTLINLRSFFGVRLQRLPMKFYQDFLYENLEDVEDFLNRE